MKRCFAHAVLLVILSGCKMKEFSSTPFYTGDEVKYSGRVEDRINLCRWMHFGRGSAGSARSPRIMRRSTSGRLA